MTIITALRVPAASTTAPDVAMETETNLEAALETLPVAITAAMVTETTATARFAPLSERNLAGDDVLRFLEHLLIDPASDRLLRALGRALVAGMGRIHLVAHGNDVMRPWQAITDPMAAPEWALGYAAQWTGGELPARLAGEADEDYLERARHEVVYPRGMRRGSYEAVLAAVRNTLTGTRSVQLLERQTAPGNAPEWVVRVITYAEETPDPDVTRREALRYAPAGIVMLVGTADGQTYQQLEDNYPTYTAVRDAYDDYEAVRTDTPTV